MDFRRRRWPAALHRLRYG